MKITLSISKIKKSLRRGMNNLLKKNEMDE
jgi:hypothetical protein